MLALLLFDPIAAAAAWSLAEEEPSAKSTDEAEAKGCRRRGVGGNESNASATKCGPPPLLLLWASGGWEGWG